MRSSLRVTQIFSKSDVSKRDFLNCHYTLDNFVPYYDIYIFFFTDYGSLSRALSESVNMLGIQSILGAKTKC